MTCGAQRGPVPDGAQMHPDRVCRRATLRVSVVYPSAAPKNSSVAQQRRLRWMREAVVAVLLALVGPAEAAAGEREPDLVIDVHRHTTPFGASIKERTEGIAKTLADMEANGIELAVVQGFDPETIAAYRSALDKRAVFGASFPCWRLATGVEITCGWDRGNWPSVEWIRKAFMSGEIGFLGELLFAYSGVSPLDPRMEPYWALADELGIPVGVHLTPGPPPGAGPRRDPACCPDFDLELGHPDQFRPVLEKYPNLKLLLQHAGDADETHDFSDATMQLVEDYPGVYVDLSVVHSLAPAEEFDELVRGFVRRGLVDRVMLGSDGLPVAPAVERYQSLGFLTDADKRAILRGNAQRFLDHGD